MFDIVHAKSFLFRHASKVLIGDDVLVQGNDELTQAKVINISSITKQGDYYYEIVNGLL